MSTPRLIALAAAGILAIATPAMAGNKLVPAGARIAIAKSTMSVLPGTEWNKLAARPGRDAETWTQDGDDLNDVTFYTGIDTGKTLFREVDRKNRPLPKVGNAMLMTDIPTLLENSYRIALDTADIRIGTVEPCTFAGAKGVRFTYLFSRPNETLRRRGEARGAIVGGKLYLVTYEAPALYYFDRSVRDFRALAESVQL